MHGAGRAGIWEFDAQAASTPARVNHYARGIVTPWGLRSARPTKALTTQHGRDQLYDWHAALGLDSVAAQKYNAENPAEELMQVNQGDDCWP